jgi:Domain of unknown function (DUF4184)
MPFTLAHPAAVLPLRRFRYLQTVSLIVGSIAPDLPYYVPARYNRALIETHTFFGSFALDIPIGMLALVCGFLLRRPLTALMSVRARALCLHAMERFKERPLDWVLAPISILIGTWTHILWDSFTHENGWMVRRVAALSAPLTVGWYTGTVCHVLQYVSSLVGLVVLAVWYRRLSPVSEPSSAGSMRASGRLVLLLVFVAAALIGGAQALQAALHAQSNYRIIYLLLTRTMAWFALLYLTAGTLVMLNRKAEPLTQI